MIDETLDAGWCASRTDYRELDRKKTKRCRTFIGSDDFKGGGDYIPQVERPGRMVLDPLAEVSIAVFMAVCIGRCQFVMDVLGDGERGQCQKEENQAQGKPALHPVEYNALTHRGRTEYHKVTMAVKDPPKTCKKRFILQYVMHSHVDFS
jgi:hypothetical protein